MVTNSPGSEPVRTHTLERVDVLVERSLISGIILLSGLALLLAWGPSESAIALIGPLWGMVAGYWLRVNGNPHSGGTG